MTVDFIKAETPKKLVFAVKYFLDVGIIFQFRGYVFNNWGEK